MTNNRTNANITAQVACEAIINDPGAYDINTMRAVLDAARLEGINSLYIGPIEDYIDNSVED